MNKYALGTIVGTSLLGFVKSKLGSNVRLTVKEEEYIESSSLVDLKKFSEEPWSDDEAEYIRQHVMQYVSQHQTPGVKVFVEDISTWQSEELFGLLGETEYFLTIKLESIVSSALEISDDQESYLASYAEGLVKYLASSYRKEYYGRLFNTELEHFESETIIKKIVVNVDTGEEYKTIEKSTKLRRR